MQRQLKLEKTSNLPLESKNQKIKKSDGLYGQTQRVIKEDKQENKLRNKGGTQKLT